MIILAEPLRLNLLHLAFSMRLILVACQAHCTAYVSTVVSGWMNGRLERLVSIIMLLSDMATGQPDDESFLWVLQVVHKLIQFSSSYVRCSNLSDEYVNMLFRYANLHCHQISALFKSWNLINRLKTNRSMTSLLPEHCGPATNEPSTHYGTHYSPW